MYQLKGSNDTIAAISTPLGQGGVAIVRLSGNDSITIASKLFCLPSKKKLKNFASHVVHYGWVVDDQEEMIDEVLMTVMRSPRSYTKEDVVEISCHGGSTSIRRVLSRALDLGARLADPGEFTKRAFLNGRIDLPQAEAVLDIIHAKTDAFLNVSLNQLKGELTLELEKIRKMIMAAYTTLEAYVNFPEDDINVAGRKGLDKDINVALVKVESLLSTGNAGKVLKDGVKIVIAGRPNVGKSSLLNILLRQPRAIVSEMAGTTRDTIEETAQIRGIPFILVDTAGILEPRDLVEKEAVERSRQSIQSADVVLLVLDASEPLTPADRQLMNELKSENTIPVINKIDRPAQIEKEEICKVFARAKIVSLCAHTKEGLDQLEGAIQESVVHSELIDAHKVLLSNVRHLQSLKNARANLLMASQILNEGISFEFVSEELKQAVNSLDAITGRNIDQDLLETIFSQFCIGK